MSDAVAPFSPVVERAIELAAEWHDGTYRKGRWRPEPFACPPGAVVRVPTMAHVTTVALTVQRAGWCDETVAAAFLHDAVEDANRYGEALTPERLTAEVGERVTAFVMAVTEPQCDADGGWLPWRARKETYLASLAAGPPEAAAIALADKTHNAFSIASSLDAGVDVFTPAPGRTALSADGDAQLWFLRAARAATVHHSDPRLDVLRERLDVEIERLARVVKGGAGGRSVAIR